jgi:AcrR family transcriptional regulator
VRTKAADLDNRILNAAARLFAGGHFHEVRMEDISAEAAVGKGTLYRYFNDKEALYDALLTRAARQMQERAAEAVRGTAPVEARLVRLVDAVLEFFDENPHLFVLIQQAEARGGDDHPWQAARVANLLRVEELLREGNRQRTFLVRDPKMTALLLLGGVRAVYRFGPKSRSARLGGELVRSVLFGASESRTHL